MEDKFFVGAKKGLNILFTLIVFVALIYVCALYSADVARQKNEAVSDLFQRTAEQASDLLHEKIKPFPLLLRSARGLILGHDDIAPESWSSFVDSLNLDYTSLGIIGLTYTESVFDYQLDPYLAKRKKRFPNFRVFPEGVREEYMVVLYLAPEAVSARVRGFDISVEEHRRNAAILARQTGLMTLTQPISLLPTETHSLDYLLLLPVYDSEWHPDISLLAESDGQFKGWATLGFSMSRLAQGVLDETANGLRIQLYDNRSGNKAVFDSKPSAITEGIPESRVLNAVLTLGGQVLTMRITPLKESGLAQSEEVYDPDALLASGLISVLITLILFLLLNSRFTAVRMASRLLEQFAESETRYKSLFELSPEAIIIHREGRILLVNQAAQTLLQVESPGLLIGRNIMDYVHKDSQQAVLARMEDSEAVMPFMEEMLQRYDGSSFLAEVSGAAIQFEGQPATQVLFRDISAEQEARYEAQISKAVFRHSHEPMMVTDAKGMISLVNPAFTDVTGFEPEDVQGKNASILSSGYHDSEFYECMWQVLLAEGEWEGEMTNRRKDGEIYIQRAHMSAIRGLHNDISQFICVMGDITEQKKELESMRFQALHDPLTRLPNRILFTSEVRKVIAIAEKEQRKFAVLFIDLDGFKPVNDTYGHLLGDKLLVALAKKLSGAIKKQDTVARVGGDEFLVLLREVDNGEMALAVAERLSVLVAEPVAIDDIEVHVGASIGVAVYPEHSGDELTLIDRADKAMYKAKHSGKGRAILALGSESSMPVSMPSDVELRE